MKDNRGDPGDDGDHADLVIANNVDSAQREQASVTETSKTVGRPSTMEENDANRRRRQSKNLKGAQMNDEVTQQLDMRGQQNEEMPGNNGVLNAKNAEGNGDQDLVDLKESLYLNIVVPSAV